MCVLYITGAENLSEHLWSPVDCMLFISLSTFHIFIFFSRNTGPISIELGTKRAWVKRIQVSSNERPLHFLRGDDSSIVRMHWQLLNIIAPEQRSQFSQTDWWFFKISSRTTGPISQISSNGKFWKTSTN